VEAGQRPAVLPDAIGTARFQIVDGKLNALDPIPGA
jgi:hypothetical protein